MRRLSFFLLALFCLVSAFPDRDAEQVGIALQKANETILSSGENIGNREGLQSTSPTIGSVTHLCSQSSAKRMGRRIVRTLDGKALFAALPCRAKAVPFVFSSLYTNPHPHAQRSKDYYVFALRHILI